MNRIADYFADTYSQARANFLAAVDNGGLRAVWRKVRVFGRVDRLGSANDLTSPLTRNPAIDWGRVGRRALKSLFHDEPLRGAQRDRGDDELRDDETCRIDGANSSLFPVSFKALPP